jgi:hypothetical protein
MGIEMLVCYDISHEGYFGAIHREGEKLHLM